MADTLLFRSDIITVGRHWLPREHFPKDPPPGALANLIVFPLSTQQITSRRSGDSVVTDRNGILLYNRGESYPIEYIDEVDRCDFLGFADEVAVELAGEIDVEATESRPFNRFFTLSDHALYWQARRLFDGHTRRSAMELEEDALALAQRAIGAAARDTRPTRTLSRHHRRLAEDAKEVLGTDEALNLTAVARAVGASPAHLSRIFRRVTGTTMHRYRSSLRLRQSVDDLTTGDLSMVAATHGFASHSHYSASFRRAFDRSPSEARLELAG